MPFTGSSPGVICGAILHQEPASASRVNPQVYPGIAAIIGKALEKDRNLRYQSAADMRADLERLKRGAEIGRLVSVTSGPVAPSLAKGKKTRWAVVTPVVGALAAALFAAGLYYRSHQSTPVVIVLGVIVGVGVVWIA